MKRRHTPRHAANANSVPNFPRQSTRSVFEPRIPESPEVAQYAAAVRASSQNHQSKGRWAQLRERMRQGQAEGDGRPNRLSNAVDSAANKIFRFGKVATAGALLSTVAFLGFGTYETHESQQASTASSADILLHPQRSQQEGLRSAADVETSSNDIHDAALSFEVALGAAAVTLAASFAAGRGDDFGEFLRAKQPRPATV